MVFGKVEGREHMPVILDLGAFGYGEAEAGEDGYNLLAHQREGMACAQRHWSCRACQVEVGVYGIGVLECLAQRREFGRGSLLELVEGLSELTLLLGGHVAEILHQGTHGTLLAQIFDAQGFDLLHVGGLEGLYLGFELIYLVDHYCVLLSEVQS